MLKLRWAGPPAIFERTMGIPACAKALAGREPTPQPCLPAVLRLSEIRESNSRLLLGKQTYYHCTNLAHAKQAGEGRVLPLYYARIFVGQGTPDFAEASSGRRVFSLPARHSSSDEDGRSYLPCRQAGSTIELHPQINIISILLNQYYFQVFTRKKICCIMNSWYLKISKRN